MRFPFPNRPAIFMAAGYIRFGAGLFDFGDVEALATENVRSASRDIARVTRVRNGLAGLVECRCRGVSYVKRPVFLSGRRRVFAFAVSYAQ